jgi:hypothetical protein
MAHRCRRWRRWTALGRVVDNKVKIGLIGAEVAVDVRQDSGVVGVASGGVVQAWSKRNAQGRSILSKCPSSQYLLSPSHHATHSFCPFSWHKLGMFSVSTVECR